MMGRIILMPRRVIISPWTATMDEVNHHVYQNQNDPQCNQPEDPMNGNLTKLHVCPQF